VPEEKSAPAAEVKSSEGVKPVPEAAEDTAPKKKTEEPARLARASRPKPRVAEAVPPKDDPLLKLAQKYIHGQGVRQDCTTGMAYLREAAKRSNPEAASQMGALYATGTCVALDRVAAYRWFTSAMQMTPDNPWLGQERDKLYGQMTIAERRQADRQ
jgi:TPR repeat protein